jgi:2-dehydro-3-deoxyphosphogluconate aldolase/(4S)-4-hydroxy-2-oxoglutarate aldolase
MAPAIAEMERRGLELDMDSVKDKDNIKAVYFKKDFGGFAVHLLQK